MDVSVKQEARKAVTSVALPRPSHEEAMQAVRTLIAWAGDDPTREGLLDTPKRVTKAFGEFFAGYDQDPKEVLQRTFKEVGGYDDVVLVKDIPFSSHCEHHMVPFVGKAHIAYLPHDGVVGISSSPGWSRYSRAACRCRKISPRRSLTPSTTTSIRGGGGDARSRAHVHVHARRAGARRFDHHAALHRRVC